MQDRLLQWTCATCRRVEDDGPSGENLLFFSKTRRNWHLFSDDLRWYLQTSSSKHSYDGAIRRLECMQRFHQFYLRYGIGTSSMLIFLATVIAVKLDRHGWGGGGNALFEATLVICLLAPVCFVVNLFLIRGFRCPRCKTETIGWVKKEAQCFTCGLEFGTHNVSGS